jgi:hypothetical protein
LSPFMPFDPENKAENPFDYPKLTLDKGERGRVNIIEPAPIVEYVHTLRAPKIVNGKPVINMVPGRDGGDPTPQTEMDFIGRPLCLGDPETLKEKGMDPERCPICEASKLSDAVRSPERRFAIHVVRYQLKQGEFDVSEPFGAQIVAWVFPDKIFNTLIEYKKDWQESPDEKAPLRKHDLLLGPCENKQFQKFDIRPSTSPAEWIRTKERQVYVAELYQKNQTPYLESLIGRRLERARLMEDLDKVLARNRVAFGGAPATAVEETVSSIDMDAIMRGESEAPAAPTEAPEAPVVATTPEAVDTDDLLASVTVPKEAEKTETPSLEDLLKEIPEP